MDIARVQMLLEGSECGHESSHYFWTDCSPEMWEDMLLWKGLQGNDPYIILLREATIALLNSYNIVQFPFHPLIVIQDTNWPRWDLHATFSIQICGS